MTQAIDLAYAQGISLAFRRLLEAAMEWLPEEDLERLLGDVGALLDEYREAA